MCLTRAIRGERIIPRQGASVRYEVAWIGLDPCRSRIAQSYRRLEMSSKLSVNYIVFLQHKPCEFHRQLTAKGIFSWCFVEHCDLPLLCQGLQRWRVVQIYFLRVDKSGSSAESGAFSGECQSWNVEQYLSSQLRDIRFDGKVSCGKETRKEKTIVSSERTFTISTCALWLLNC